MSDDNQSLESSSAAPDRPAERQRWSPHLWLILALGGAAALALLPRKAPVVIPSAAAPPSAEAPRAAGGVSAARGPVIEGKVVERLDVPKYTVLALDTGGGAAHTWVAVSSASVKVGDAVRVVNAERMTNFTSATLKRTFETIYFGSLEDPANRSASQGNLGGWAAPGGDPHAGVPGAPPLGPGATPHADANPHGRPTSPRKDVVVSRVEKAEGSSGRTVAETYAQRRALSGKRVRVRAVVVKVVSGVLDRSFVHVRDGSENGEVSDLLVTTRALPAVGERVLFEGTVAIDRDFGAGYRYPVLLEDAEIVGERASSSLL
jgi:hypothetical protein